MSSSAEPEARFTSVKSMCIILGISKQSAFRLLDEGRVESRYVGRRRLVSISSLDDFIAHLPATRDE